jgi:hypothetical protein
MQIAADSKNSDGISDWKVLCDVGTALIRKNQIE